MAYIGKKPEDAFRGLAYYDTFTGDGSTTTFDLSADAPDGGQNDITVVVDNVRQEPGASKSYTLGLDGSSRYRRITFNVAPDNLSEIYVINPGRSTQLNTVSDNAITAAKLQTDAVTTAKIQDSAVTNDKLAGSIANAKLANSSITINGTAVSLGGSVTAGTDWQAVTVADGSTTLNAVAGKGYFLDTNAGTIDVNLPTSPTRGDTIVIADYGNNFATNRVIINTGGKLIDSVVGGDPGSSGFTIDTNGAVVELVFADDTAGWIIKQNNVPSDLGAESYIKYVTATGGTVTTSGDYKIHTFTGDGCFVVSCAGNSLGSTQVDYLVVAGGGGGGGTDGGDATGGGGAGGYRESCGGVSGCYTASPLAAPCSAITVSGTTYPVTVGAGGTGGPDENIRGTNGSNSVFSTITSTGGGSGGPKGTPRTGPTGVGNPGGSGGGGGGGSPSAISDGSGNTPPVSPPQGNNGGSGGGAIPDNSGGGGGGAGGTGQPNNTRTSSNPTNVAYGGVGVTTSISGSPTGYAGGGGGGSYPSIPVSSNTNPGSPFGGGLGGYSNNQTAGSANTGGGGGAGGANPPAPGTTGGAGGKGIVIIRYKFQN